MKMPGILILAACFLGFIAAQVVTSCDHRREVETLGTYKARLDRQCAFERLHLDGIARDLDVEPEIGLLEFERLGGDDYRAIWLCFDEHVTHEMVFPDPRSLTKAQRAQTFVRLMRFYLQ
jgi:hypothetical protein